MNKSLHNLIQESEELARRKGIDYKDVCLDTGIPPRTYRRWKSRDLKQPGQYRESPEDESREYLLQDWVDEHRDRTEGPKIQGATSDEEFNLDRAIEEQQRRFEDKNERAEKKQNQVIEFPGGPVCLVFFGDQHIGAAGTNIKRIFREQEIVLNTPNAYAIEAGDVVNNMVIEYLKDKNMKPGSPIWEQWKVAEEYLNRWDDRIVAYCGGNHGAYTEELVKIDYRREICPKGVLYDGDDIQTDVRVGGHEYSIWLRHKWSGNSIYNPTHGQERAMRFQDPSHDLYVGAHTHEGSMFREIVYNQERKAAIQLGTYKVHDDYARKENFPKGDGSTACAVILHEDGSFHGMADLKAAQRFMKAVS